MRKIGDGTPPQHYLPQIQLCLEICNLEVAHFIQYRPSSLTWPMPDEFVVTEVLRDREWFREALPKLRAVHEEIQTARESARAGEPLPYPPPVRKIRQKRKAVCLINDAMYGTIPPFPEPAPVQRQAAVCLFPGMQTECMFPAAKVEQVCMF